MGYRELAHEAGVGSRGHQFAFAYGHQLLGEMRVVDHAPSVGHVAPIAERFRLK
jgi:hypothetical protein